MNPYVRQFLNKDYELQELYCEKDVDKAIISGVHDLLGIRVCSVPDVLIKFQLYSKTVITRLRPNSLWYINLLLDRYSDLIEDQEVIKDGKVVVEQIGGEFTNYGCGYLPRIDLKHPEYRYLNPELSGYAYFSQIEIYNIELRNQEFRIFDLNKSMILDRYNSCT